jgi:transposase-like protein
MQWMSRVVQSKVYEDPDFYFRFELDSAQRLRHVFWMTPQQRRNYVLYHDCISMDSTFGTNRFRMPLVLVVGVDGEGQTILLGTGLLSDERSSSYEWLLMQLREAGYLLPPGVIFTDGDPVFPDVIASVFPGTRHYLCAWHLSQNIIKAVAGRIGVSTPMLMDAFSRCRKIKSVEEFEREWQSVLTMSEMAPVSDYLAGLTNTKARGALRWVGRRWRPRAL